MRNRASVSSVTYKVTASKLIVPILFALAGFGVGAFVYPGPYVYGNDSGASTRINRFAGVEQYASSKGWVSREEFVKDTMTGTFAGMGQGIRSMTEPPSSPPGSMREDYVPHL